MRVSCHLRTVGTECNLCRRILHICRLIAVRQRQEQVGSRLNLRCCQNTLERRVDAEFLNSAQEQPSFHIISAVRLCIPSACRPERDAGEKEFHSWLFYHLRILQTLQALLTSAPLLSFDSTMCDTIAIDLSDALAKSALTVQTFPSLKAYHPDGVAENKYAFLTLKAHIGSLSEDARAKVNKNLEAVKGMAYFQGGDSD